MIHLIYIYLILNSLLAGAFWYSEVDNVHFIPFTERLAIIGGGLFIFIFGVPLFIGIGIIQFIENSIKNTDEKI